MVIIANYRGNFVLYFVQIGTERGGASLLAHLRRMARERGFSVGSCVRAVLDTYLSQLCAKLVLKPLTELCQRHP